ncbi:PLP-dependent aminotransferase family protein [Desulfovibrio sp. X2]|uniref:aminotransferase-like domain-containing protein n=1 Tax=Desulfovibrio sp. X2 TaxID=941449 RepID=UPI0004050DBF|nr:PLP-dependent aminotransferase family protein [Desulfovibrio sp. X2]
MPHLHGGEGPLYLALADALAADVAGGSLRPGQRLPTHRDLADALGVTVGTVTRGYAEAQRRGLVTGTVGRGTFVAQAVSVDPSMGSGHPFEPGIAELGLVAPPPGDPDLGEGLRRLAGKPGIDKLLRYHLTPGLPPHRATGVRWAARYGLDVDPGAVIVAAGAQHALTLCLMGLLRPGERIACDPLTYPGLKTLAAQLGILLTAVPGDEAGMSPEALDTACRRDEIHAVYLMPSVQNPTTTCIPVGRREELAAVAARRGLVIIEDDVYALTRREQGVPLAALAPEHTVFIAGLSKVLCAGLRIAFIVAPPAYRRQLSEALLNTMWMAPPLMAELAAMWIDDGTADSVREARLLEAERRNALAVELLGAGVSRGFASGYFRWLTLPAGWSGALFEAAAREAGVNVFAAERFAVGHAPVDPAVRVALTATEGLSELGRALRTLGDLMASGESGMGPVGTGPVF